MLPLDLMGEKAAVSGLGSGHFQRHFHTSSYFYL